MDTNTQNAHKINQNTGIHDRIARKYDRHHPEIFNSIEQTRLLRCLTKSLEHVGTGSSPIRALDMGCGSGNLTSHLMNLECKVTAADVSQKFLNLVSERFSGDNLTTSLLNGTDLSQFADREFDFIATYSVLHHIPDYLSAVGEMGRVCSPGGIVYIDHESVEHVWKENSQYKSFKKEVMTNDYKKWLRPINYYGKFRRLFDPKYANEGDIHVWPDDHIRWDLIAEKLGDAFYPVVDDKYLLFDSRYKKSVYEKYSKSLTDMRTMAFRKKL